MINLSSIAKMKKGVILINTSRGKVIETSALIQGLKSGHIGGVALDTYEEEEGVFFEDLSDKILLDDELSRLITFPNVVMTAHQGFFTREAMTEIARITVANLLRLKEKKSFSKEHSCETTQKHRHDGTPDPSHPRSPPPRLCLLENELDRSYLGAFYPIRSSYELVRRLPSARQEQLSREKKIMPTPSPTHVCRSKMHYSLKIK